MRLLYIIESLMPGGKERRLVTLINGLLKSNNYLIEIIILSDRIHYKEIFDMNLNIHFLKRNILKDVRIIFKFNKIIDQFKPNLVHCWDNIAAIHFAPVCNLKKIPFINSMISTAPPLLSLVSKRYILNAISYAFSDVILTNSKAGLYSFRVPKKKGKYIYNGLNLDRLKVKKSKEIVKKELNINSEKIIGMTASFSDKKDYETFVNSAKRILLKRKDIIFIAIGDGPNLPGIIESIDSEFMLNFRFLGQQYDVESIVNVFDIGVLATFTEGVSNAIMEYMVFKKPVIATEGGGTNELIIDEDNGFLIEVKNVDQLVGKIDFLLEHPEIAKTMGIKGKKRIQNYFTIDKMVNNTIELYESFN